MKNKMRPIHPGEILREEFLEPLGMSANHLAQVIAVPANRVSEIVAERRALTADTALLSYVFSPEGLSCVVVTAAGAEVVPLRGWTEARTDLPALRSDLDMSAAVRSGPMAEVVRRSLEAAGFQVERRPGHGRKRHMSAGRLQDVPNHG